VLVALILSSHWVMEAVMRWGILAGLAVFYELRIFKNLLPLFVSDKNERSADIDFATKLMVLSGLCYALLAGFLLVTPPKGGLGWIPAILALGGILTDILSMVSCRRRCERAQGNQQLASEFRALGTLALTAVAVHYGKIDAWFLLIGAMEYLILFTHGWLSKKGRSLLGEGSSSLRLPWRYLYHAILTLTMLPVAGNSALHLAGLAFALLYFLTALRDWFILAGLIDPNQSQYQQIKAGFQSALTGWLALSIRLLAAMAVATVVADMVFHFEMYAEAFRSDLGAGVIILLLVTVSPFLLMGIRARLFALIGFAALGGILLMMGQNEVINIGLILLGLTAGLGQGTIAVEKAD
jgi:hypothetical protein